MDWSQVPKVELHLHLDCSLSHDVVFKIDPSVTLEEYRTDFIAPAKCTDLAEFLWSASLRRLTGIYHIAGAERTSLHRFAADLARSWC